MNKTTWELPEIVAGSILLAVAALVAGGLASGIAGAVANSDAVPGEGAAQILSDATGSWAGVFSAFMVLAGLLVIWRQVNTWSEMVDSLEGAAGPSALRGESFELDEKTDEAVRHLLRAGEMARWAGILIGVMAVGTVVYFISYEIQQGSTAGDPFVWQLRISTVGGLAATLVLCTAGIVSATSVRRRCSEYLSVELEEELDA
jgi:hypothetical protein